jgi:hypothetical protein
MPRIATPTRGANISLADLLDNSRDHLRHVPSCQLRNKAVVAVGYDTKTVCGDGGFS